MRARDWQALAAVVLVIVVQQGIGRLV
jgi:hypothetical protein